MFTAFLDACVMVPIAPCDTMLRMAHAGTFRPIWSQKVIDEALRALVEIHPSIDASRFHSRFQNMNEAFDDALVTEWEDLVASLTLPDPDDRHVLAAAIVGRADIIVTENTKDFPQARLAKYGIEAVRLDHFLLDNYDLNPTEVKQIIEKQAAAMKRPPVTVELLLDRLERSGARNFASKMRDALSEVS